MGGGPVMDYRPLGRTGLMVSHLGWGTVKIGRNAAVKYPNDFQLPTDTDAINIIGAMLDQGITLIDTAPAYGLAESRIGSALGSRRDGLILCTKVGEQFDGQQSHHDFSGEAARRSLEESLRRLRTDHVDITLVHSDGRDVDIQTQTDLVETLVEMRDKGLTRCIGFSGKTPEGATMALSWSDVLMCTYNAQDRDHEEVIASAAQAGVGVILKKVLGSGHLPAAEAIAFAGRDAPIASQISSIVIGSMNPQRMAQNADQLARAVRESPGPNQDEGHQDCH